MTLRYIEPARDLKERVLARIHIEEKQATRRQVVFSGILSIMSFAGAIPALLFLLRSASESGFYEYMSLALTDLGPSSVYWKELLFSLAESAPVLAGALFLSAVALFIWSLTKTISTSQENILWI